MIAGIYGADPRSLSLAATMPRFLEMERTHGSVIRALRSRRIRLKLAGGRTPNSGSGLGKPVSSPSAESGRDDGREASATDGGRGGRDGLFVSFHQGMQTLVDALAGQIPEHCIRRSTRAVGLARTESGGWRVSLAGEHGTAQDDGLNVDAVC